MKNILITLLLIISFGGKLFAQGNHEIQIVNNIPNWAKNLTTINLGKYGDYLMQDNPKEQILAFHSWGDRSMGITPPFKEFLYLTVDNNNLFLKFISIKKNGKHYIQTYIDGNLKVILDYNGSKVTNSRNGDGGILYIYFNNKLIKKYNFWASI